MKTPFIARFLDFTTRNVLYEEPICLKSLKNQLNARGGAVFTISSNKLDAFSPKSEPHPLFSSDFLTPWAYLVEISQKGSECVLFSGFVSQICSDLGITEVTLAPFSQILRRWRTFSDFSFAGGTLGAGLMQFLSENQLNISLSGIENLQDASQTPQTTQILIPQLADSLLDASFGTLPCPVNAGDSFIISQNGAIGGQNYEIRDLLVANNDVTACPATPADFSVTPYPLYGATSFAIPAGVASVTLSVLAGGVIVGNAGVYPDGLGINGATLNTGDSLTMNDAPSFSPILFLSQVGGNALVQISYSQPFFVPLGDSVLSVLDDLGRRGVSFIYENGELRFFNPENENLQGEIMITERCEDCVNAKNAYTAIVSADGTRYDTQAVPRRVFFLNDEGISATELQNELEIQNREAKTKTFWIPLPCDGCDVPKLGQKYRFVQKSCHDFFAIDELGVVNGLEYAEKAGVSGMWVSFFGV